MEFGAGFAAGVAFMIFLDALKRWLETKQTADGSGYRAETETPLEERKLPQGGSSTAPPRKRTMWDLPPRTPRDPDAPVTRRPLGGTEGT